MIASTDVGPACDGCGTPSGKGMWAFSLPCDVCASDDLRFVVEAKCVCCHKTVRFMAPAADGGAPETLRARMVAHLQGVAS